MQITTTKPTQVFHLLFMLLILFNLAFDYTNFLERAEVIDSSFMIKTLFYMGYFTIFSNFSMAIVSGVIAFKPNIKTEWFNSLRLYASICMVITFLIYNIVLRPSFSPTSLTERICSEINHLINPLLVIVSWLYIYKKPLMSSVKVLYCSIIPPIGYLIYMLVHGFFTNTYPYFFLNVTKLGYPKVLTVVALVFGAYFLLSYLIAIIDKYYFTKQIPSEK